ncbi:MAG: hypothetical protein ACREXM_03045 [Gammaproteobacteria bacterium]
MSVIGHQSQACYTQKKVGALPIDSDSEERKQTNEITMAAPLLAAIDITAKDYHGQCLIDAAQAR